MSDTNQGTYRILVVEDEESLAEGIAENLQLEGYETEIAPDGLHAMERIRAGTWDLILLDVMLPGMDGYTICQTARSEGIEIPVLFLTAKGSTGDRIRGLEAGGDDYLSKPFALKELLLRVAAILRRKSWYLKPEDAAGATLSFGGNTIDFKTYQGKAWDGSEQHLTHKEALILKCLADRTGQIVSREEILEQVWGYEIFPSTRTIDNFIVRLRKRFEREPEAPRHFHTQRGVGYRFTCAPADDAPRT
ncbi:MAG: response regulator transcription factor [Planctomycetota bacterium]|nr:response regulator transcription factor [Planctomycetota bacterium]MDG2144838.1 response regulator transcription factor [Planctomycetota bacterium]